MSETAQKRYAIGDLFTEDELKRAEALYRKAAAGTFNATCLREIVTPEVVARIDAKTGQANHPQYLAYVVEYALLAVHGAARK